jgi:hypothetical protein
MFFYLWVHFISGIKKLSSIWVRTIALIDVFQSIGRHVSWYPFSLAFVDSFLCLFLDYGVYAWRCLEICSIYVFSLGWWSWCSNLHFIEYSYLNNILSKTYLLNIAYPVYQGNFLVLGIAYLHLWVGVELYRIVMQILVAVVPNHCMNCDADIGGSVQIW